MRWAEIKESEFSRLPKPSYVIPYSDEDDEGHVFQNPSAGTLAKCIGQFDGRAILYEDGVLLVWPQADMYHQDVYDALKREKHFITLMLQSPTKYGIGAYVSVKSGDEEPVPFTDERWLALLHGNRGLRTLYGEDFAVDQMNWW